MLAENLIHFSRILRDTGMAVGPDRVLAAIAAVEAVGLERREDVRAALAAVMLERHEQQTLFDAAFLKRLGLTGAGRHQAEDHFVRIVEIGDTLHDGQVAHVERRFQRQ